MVSVLFVLHDLAELRMIGEFKYFLIKKRRYRPKYFPRNMIDDHMAVKEDFNIDTLNGYVDNIHYGLFVLWETDCIMEIMYTYGEFLVPTHQK